MKLLTIEDIKYFDKTVFEWNLLFGNDPENKDLIPVYVNLCLEEGSEGLTAKTLEEELDAITDSIYTGFFLNRLTNTLDLQNKFTLGVVWDDVEWKHLMKQLEGKHVDYYVNDLITKVLDLSDKYNIVGAFNRVTESNFSKAISKEKVNSGEIIIADCIKEVYDTGRYTSVFAEETDTHFIIKAKFDTQENKEYPSGKIVKGSWYSSVEDLGGLSEFIY
ncbi:hypothetical protein [Vibrio phage vB_VibM_10AMN]|uniref:Uncharacterized protein n=1 Tax=Staphylococcus phage vB_VibM_10AMN12 TaxID=3076785 RepID=A0AA96KSS3_9CAUD|nr:hypothetical protein [Vibrio phage vB_VibM_10AMN]WNO47536.1 hypothetical protein [Staphylococcus phage vB_VibM_10AMN12]